MPDMVELELSDEDRRIIAYYLRRDRSWRFAMSAAVEFIKPLNLPLLWCCGCFTWRKEGHRFDWDKHRGVCSRCLSKIGQAPPD